MTTRKSARPNGAPGLVLKTAAVAVAAVALLAGAPAGAHHSAALYDRSKPIVLKGVVKELNWSNPHSWVEILTEGAKPTSWTIELEGPSVMQREGWSSHSLLPGDRITAHVMPLKDGRAGARLIDLTRTDGTTLYLFTPRQNVG